MLGRLVRWIGLIWIASIGVEGAWASATAQTIASEDQVKAGVLLNVARFAEWSGPAGQPVSGELRLCFVDGASLGPALTEWSGRQLGARRVATIRVPAPNALLGNCDVAYVSETDLKGVSLAALERAQVLVVSDAKNFARYGAIGLITLDRRVRFEVNLAALQRAQITLSSRVLQLAAIVEAN